eukprot:EG_transcript_43002
MSVDTAVAAVATALKAALLPFEQRLKTLSTENTELQRRVTVLEAANQTAKEDSREIEKLLSEDNAEIAGLRKRLKALEEAEAAQAEALRANGALQARVAALEEQLLQVLDTVLGPAAESPEGWRRPSLPPPQPAAPAPA